MLIPDEYAKKRIIQRCLKKYGRIQKAEEDMYLLLLNVMERNAANVIIERDINDDRYLMEGIQLALLVLEGRLAGEETDVSAIESENGKALKHAFLMAFDPETNPELKDAVNHYYPEPDALNAFPEDHYQKAIRLLCRETKSVEIWNKQLGRHGMIDVILSTMKKVKAELDGKMHYACAIDSKHPVLRDHL